MERMTQRRVRYEELTTGYEFQPGSFRLDCKIVTDYLEAVEDNNDLYKKDGIVPPMVVAARAMAAMASGLALPPGAIHVSQELKFGDIVSLNETLTSYARVSRKVERGKFHMLTISISVLNQAKATVLTGETSFILPQS